MRRQRVDGKLTEADVVTRLARKFAAPEYAFLPQVNQGTGSHAGRRADGVAMSVWPSRGLHLHGFEVKVSRGDFLSELKQPAKSDAIQRYCHFWWLVTAKDVIRDGDMLPPTWGWMETEGAGLTIRKHAAQLSAEPWSIPFVASVLRAASDAIPQLKEEYVPAADVEAQVSGRVAKELEKRDPAVKALRELLARVATFEGASGVSISRSYDRVEKIGAAVKMVLDAKLMSTLRQRISWERQSVASVLASLDALCDQDEALFPGISEPEEASA